MIKFTLGKQNVQLKNVEKNTVEIIKIEIMKNVLYMQQ